MSSLFLEFSNKISDFLCRVKLQLPERTCFGGSKHLVWSNVKECTDATKACELFELASVALLQRFVR